MQDAPLSGRIVEAFGAMPPQLQTAARYILDFPGDVALLSMREQSKRAGVQPWTMTRLAQRLGLAGYDEVRELYGRAVRDGALGFARRAGTQVLAQRERGDRGLALDILDSTRARIDRIAEPEVLDRLVDAAGTLASAERIYCLGLRSCHAVTAHFAYVMSFLGERAISLDAAAGTGLDSIRNASAQDALLVASVAPYTRTTIEAARYADSRGVPIVAITDSLVSPLASLARQAIVVSTDGPSFFHAMAPAFVVGEMLAALVAGRGGERSLAAIRQTEDQLTAFGIHWPPRGGGMT